MKESRNSVSKRKTIVMGSDKESKLGVPSSAEMKVLLGPAPILSTESVEQFEQVFDRLVACLDVQDMVEGILIWGFVVPSWEINRYTRYRAVSFDRSFKQNLDFQVQRAKDQKAKRQELAAKLAQYATRKSRRHCAVDRARG